MKICGVMVTLVFENSQLFLNIKKSVSQTSLSSQIDPENGLLMITNNNFWVIKCEVIMCFPLCLLMSPSLAQIMELAGI